jgi:hypothetical protein
VTLSPVRVFKHTLRFNDNKPGTEQHGHKGHDVERKEYTEAVHEKANHDKSPILTHLGNGNSQLVGVYALMRLFRRVYSVPKVEHNSCYHQYAHGKEHPNEQVEFVKWYDCFHVCVVLWFIR